MKKLTVKSYALKHKLSVFNVLKMVKSGKLDTETVEENGKEVTYILLDTNIETDNKEILPIVGKSRMTLEEEINKLNREVEFLRKEIDLLKKGYS